MPHNHNLHNPEKDKLCEILKYHQTGILNFQGCKGFKNK